jgi:hypothetical protein
MRRPLLLAIPALLLASSAMASPALLPPGEVAVLQRPERRVARPQPAPPRPTDFLLIAVTGGPVFIPGRGVGAFGRGGIETLLCRNAEGTGPLYGVTSALEGYSAPASGGLSLAIGWNAGLATKRLLATVGFGTNVLTFEMLNKVAGFGVLSPRANARLGVRAGRYTFAATAEMQYRWQWLLEDQRIFGVGVSLLYAVDAAAGR